MTGYRETFYVIGVNDTFNHFRSDLISQENLTTLTFAQVISKARDFEASLKTESAITRQQLEESDCTRSHLVRIQHTKRHPVQSNPKPLTFLQTTRCPYLFLLWLHTTCSSLWSSCLQWHLSPLRQKGSLATSLLSIHCQYSDSSCQHCFWSQHCSCHNSWCSRSSVCIQTHLCRPRS